MDEGARTLDNRNHNPGLYQLSYNHHNNILDSTTSNDLMVRLTGLEPVTIRLEGGCSIQLSYRRITYDQRSLESLALKNWSEQ